MALRCPASRRRAIVKGKKKDLTQKRHIPAFSNSHLAARAVRILQPIPNRLVPEDVRASPADPSLVSKASEDRWAPGSRTQKQTCIPQPSCVLLWRSVVINTISSVKAFQPLYRHSRGFVRGLTTRQHRHREVWGPRVGHLRWLACAANPACAVENWSPPLINMERLALVQQSLAYVTAWLQRR